MRNFDNLNLRFKFFFFDVVHNHRIAAYYAVHSATPISTPCPFLRRCFDAPKVWQTSRVMAEAENMDTCRRVRIHCYIQRYMRIYEDICRHIETWGGNFGCFDAPKVFSASNMSFPRIFDKLIWKYSQTPRICNSLTPPMKDTSEYKVFKKPAFFNHLVLHMKVHHINTINRLGLFHFPSPLLCFLAKSIS